MTAHDDEERAHHLMMAALDGELSSEEQSELDDILRKSPQLQREWNEMVRVKEVTAQLSLREPPAEVWQEYWTSVYNRLERRAGWALLSLGAIVVIGYATWNATMDMLHDTTLPFLVKLGVFSLLMGGFVLLASVAREKWFTASRDAYKEIQR